MSGAIRKTARVLGGGGHYHYPQHVWSPSGGWWCNPVNWKQNTMVAFGGVAVCFSAIFTFSAGHERRPMAPRHGAIPSQSWSAYAKEDDPSLGEK